MNDFPKNQSHFKEAFERMNGCRFASIHYFNESGGEALYKVQLAVSMPSVYVSDLERIDEALENPKTPEKDAVILKKIRVSRLTSLEKGIGNHPDNPLKGKTESVANGLRFVNGKLQILCLVVSKTVFRQELFVSSQNHREMVSEKYGLKSSKIRTFSLDPKKFRALRVMGENLEIEIEK